MLPFATGEVRIIIIPPVLAGGLNEMMHEDAQPEPGTL